MRRQLLAFILLTLVYPGFRAVQTSTTDTQAASRERTTAEAQSTPSNIPRTAPLGTLGIHETKGTLFENVVAVLESKYYDQNFRSSVLPKLAAEYAERAKSAKTLGEERTAVHEFLSHIPASHLGLLSSEGYRLIAYDLQGRPYPMFGFMLMNLDGKYYASSVLEGGPAARAGLLSGDRIITVDGTAVAQSPRLDWRSDDAYMSDDRDPPVHHVLAEKDAVIKLKVERTKGKFLDIAIPADNYSAFAAAKASARVINSGGHTFGYIHFWFIHVSGVAQLLKDKFEGEFSHCDGIVVDMRGRGGNGAAIAGIIEALRQDHAARNRPIVALYDRYSRSAKDVLAYEMKRTGVARVVGEQTAGAVIPATFADVGHDTVLMFPSFKLPKYTDLLEGKPTQPDVLAHRAGPLSAGRDPILEAGIAEALKMVVSTAKAGAAASTTNH